MHGWTGDDRIAAAPGALADYRLHGDAGNDSLQGGAGDDLLDGGTGHDTLAGGPGHDRYVVDAAGDRVQGEAGFAQGGGIDTVEAWVSYTLPGNVEVLRLMGSAGLSGTGSAAPDALVGNTGANVLSGGYGNDMLNGKEGVDALIGDHGADTLVGDTGNDTFVYLAVSDSRAGTANRDFINGFVHGQDRIDLSAIDANALTGTNDAFAFVTGFTGAAGQVRAYTWGGGNFCLVEADRDGDRTADMQVFVNLTTFMTAADFVL